MASSTVRQTGDVVGDRAIGHQYQELLIALLDAQYTAKGGLVDHLADLGATQFALGNLEHVQQECFMGRLHIECRKDRAYGAILLIVHSVRDIGELIADKLQVVIVLVGDEHMSAARIVLHSRLGTQRIIHVADRDAFFLVDDHVAESLAPLGHRQIFDGQAMTDTDGRACR